MRPKDAAGIANSEDPDQTAPLRVVWSGSALIVQTCLSENLGPSRVLFSEVKNIFLKQTVFMVWRFTITLFM